MEDIEQKNANNIGFKHGQYKYIIVMSHQVKNLKSLPIIANAFTHSI